MIRDLVINAGMLIAFLSICYHIFGNTGIGPRLPLKLQIRLGLFFGALGCILVEYAIRLSNGQIFDLRILAIFVATLYSGIIPGLISGAIIALFRLFRYGLSMHSIISSISMLILPLLMYPFFNLRKKMWRNWVYGILICELVVTLNYIIFIRDRAEMLFILLFFYLATNLASPLLFLYIKYLEEYTYAFRRYKLEAKRDYLTGLNNVRQFDSTYNNVIEKTRVTGQNLSLLFIDIDFFKKVNDSYGHKEGDIVLKKLGNILLQSCRNLDIVSRNGGEEFSVILIDCSWELAQEIAERIRRKVESTPFILSDGTGIKITVSVGIASYPDIITELDTLKEKADEALYVAKRTGRNKIILAK